MPGLRIRDQNESVSINMILPPRAFPHDVAWHETCAFKLSIP